MAIASVVIGAVVSAAVGAAANYALQPDIATPNLAAANREGILAETETLPYRRQLEAAARQGKKVTIDDFPAHTEVKKFYWVPGNKEWDWQHDDRIPGSGTDEIIGGLESVFGGKRTTWHMVPAEEWEEGGKFFGQAIPPYGGGENEFQIPAGPKTFDFTGYGEADVQSKIADQMAGIMLDLDKKYGSQFIDEALKQQELADPQGKAARDKLYDLIQQQAGATPERPVADLLDSQVRDQLAAGRGLDATSQTLLDEAIASAAAARGDQTAGTAWADPLTTGFEGQQRLDAGQQKALGWLSSGATPEDVDYRRQQQVMANLASFINGQTPQSQFAALSGAQQGATPVRTGPDLPTNNNSSSSAAENAALQTYGTQLNNASNQASPWLAGLSTLLTGLNTAGKAGYLGG